MKKLLKKVLLVLLVLGIVSNSVLHVINSYQNRAIGRRLNETEFRNGFATYLILQRLQIHTAVLTYLVDKYIVPDFEELFNGIVLILQRHEQGITGGGGVCIREDDENYYIVTAKHVISNPVNPNPVLKVRLYNQVVELETEVVKKHDFVDLALVKIKKIEGLELNVIKLAEEEPNIGDNIYNIGHPLAITHMVTKGIISTYKQQVYVIVDAMTTFGNSGGGVFNNRGELVGITISVPGYFRQEALRDSEGKIIRPAVKIPESNIGIAIRLTVIKEFLEQ